LLPPDQSDSPDQSNMTDVTDVTRFSESCPINSDADQSFEKTRHNLSSVTSATKPYPPSPCCGEPIEPK
jgi:hypothetical protein